MGVLEKHGRHHVFNYSFPLKSWFACFFSSFRGTRRIILSASSLYFIFLIFFFMILRIFYTNDFLPWWKFFGKSMCQWKWKAKKYTDTTDSLSRAVCSVPEMHFIVKYQFLNWTKGLFAVSLDFVHGLHKEDMLVSCYNGNLWYWNRLFPRYDILFWIDKFLLLDLCRKHFFHFIRFFFKV